MRRQLEGLAIELRDHAEAVRESVVGLAEILSQARLEQQARLESIVDQFERRARLVSPAPSLESVSALIGDGGPVVVLNGVSPAVKSGFDAVEVKSAAASLQQRKMEAQTR